MNEVSGPSAIGGGWRRFVHLTWLISKKEFKLTYFGSGLGYVWSFMQPLLFFGVLYVVFAVIVNFNRGALDFPVLLLMNIVLFGFFQAGTGGSIASVLVRENLVRKMHFPRLVIPLATVITAAMQLVL
ncbi:MAG: ABC transporter permease, partial [Thermoanaerobaculia bacterium]